MVDDHEPDTKLFLVRFAVQDEDSPFPISGSVKDVKSGQTRFFREWTDILRLLKAMSRNKADNQHLRENQLKED